MELEDLRLIVLNERESGKLGEISPEIFRKARKSLSGLYQQAHREAHSLDTFLSDRAHTVLDEFTSMKETLQDIVRLRTRKILTLAMLQTESSSIDTYEIKKMLPEEKMMYEEMLGAIRKCQTQLLSYEFTGLEEEVPVTAGEAVERSGGAEEFGREEEEDAPVPETSYAVIRVLEDLDAFMGIDGRIYNLGKEDLVTIPKMNADVLVERNIALNIRVGK